MALENIYNVPEVCSGMLRIAPRALQILHFLGGGPPNPPPSYRPPKRRRRLSGTLSHLTPPGEKSWIRPCSPPPSTNL